MTAAVFGFQVVHNGSLGSVQNGALSEPVQF